MQSLKVGDHGTCQYGPFVGGEEILAKMCDDGIQWALLEYLGQNGPEKAWPAHPSVPQPGDMSLNPETTATAPTRRSCICTSPKHDTESHSPN